MQVVPVAHDVMMHCDCEGEGGGGGPMLLQRRLIESLCQCVVLITDGRSVLIGSGVCVQYITGKGVQNFHEAERLEGPTR